MNTRGQMLTKRKNHSDPFKYERPQRAHYIPTEQKYVTKSTKITSVITDEQTTQDTDGRNEGFLIATNTVTSNDADLRDMSSQFDESWPTSERPKSLFCSRSSVGESNTSEMRASHGDEGMQSVSSSYPTSSQSVLSKYIERFRTGAPMSRDSRREVSDAQSADFWWLHSDKEQDSGKTRVNTDMVSTPDHVRKRRSVLEESTEKLQEKAEKLLLESETSWLTSEGCVSTDGLGSSPSSVRSTSTQPFSRPAFTRALSSAEGTGDMTGVSRTNLIQPMKTMLPQDDILYQWRLRRKMEQARNVPATDRGDFVTSPGGIHSIVLDSKNVCVSETNVQTNKTGVSEGNDGRCGGRYSGRDGGDPAYLRGVPRVGCGRVEQSGERRGNEVGVTENGTSVKGVSNRGMVSLMGGVGIHGECQRREKAGGGVSGVVCECCHAGGDAVGKEHCRCGCLEGSCGREVCYGSHPSRDSGGAVVRHKVLRAERPDEALSRGLSERRDKGDDGGRSHGRSHGDSDAPRRVSDRDACHTRRDGGDRSDGTSRDGVLRRDLGFRRDLCSRNVTENTRIRSNDEMKLVRYESETETVVHDDGDDDRDDNGDDDDDTDAEARTQFQRINSAKNQTSRKKDILFKNSANSHGAIREVGNRKTRLSLQNARVSGADDKMSTNRWKHRGKHGYKNCDVPQEMSRAGGETYAVHTEGVDDAIGQVIRDRLFDVTQSSVSLDGFSDLSAISPLPTPHCQHPSGNQPGDESDGEFADDQLLSMLRTQRSSYEQQLRDIDSLLAQMDSSSVWSSQMST